MGDNTQNNTDPQKRQQQDQQSNTQRQAPGQQNQQGASQKDPNAGESQRRIDTDGDGITRDANDKSPDHEGKPVR